MKYFVLFAFLSTALYQEPAFANYDELKSWFASSDAQQPEWDKLDGAQTVASCYGRIEILNDLQLDFQTRAPSPIISKQQLLLWKWLYSGGGSATRKKALTSDADSLEACDLDYDDYGHYRILRRSVCLKFKSSRSHPYEHVIQYTLMTNYENKPRKTSVNYCVFSTQP